MYGLTRGVATLVGVAAAGVLLWLASQLDMDVTGDYWGAVGLAAAAGLAMALMQIAGGWTKWGLPRVTGPVFLLGFVPALVAGGLVLLYAQPDSGSFGAGWAGDLGFAYLADDLEAVVLPIALVIGLAFGVTFDTSGRRVAADEAVVASDRRDDAYDRRDYAPEDADEPTLAERRAVAPGEVDRDRDGVPDRDEEYAVTGNAEDGSRRRFLRR